MLSKDKKEFGILGIVIGSIDAFPASERLGAESGFLSVNFLSGLALGQIPDLRDSSDEPKSALGIHGAALSVPELLLRFGRICLGMYLMLMIGTRGAYKSPLPDFMVFLGYQELPPHWEPFYSFWFASGAVLWVPGRSLSFSVSRLPFADQGSLFLDSHPGTDLRMPVSCSSATILLSAATMGSPTSKTSSALT